MWKKYCVYLKINWKKSDFFFLDIPFNQLHLKVFAQTEQELGVKVIYICFVYEMWKYMRISINLSTLRLNLCSEHMISPLKFKYFWKKVQFGPNNLWIKAQAMSDYINWMCSTSAKCNSKFFVFFPWRCERVIILLWFDIMWLL